MLGNLQTVQDYISEKVQKVNLNNLDRANGGAKLLRLHKKLDQDLATMTQLSLETIQIHFTMDTTQNPAGTAKLTALSSSIGKQIGRFLQRNPLPWASEIALGDLFIEAYYKLGYVDLKYPKMRNSCWVVLATLKWAELADIPQSKDGISIVGINDKPIPPVTTVIQTAKIEGRPETTHTLVKGWTSADQGKLEENYGRPWLQAVDNLQSVGWRVNQKVLEAVLEHKSMFVSEVPIYDNAEKEQKRRSKALEYRFVTGKAIELAKLNEFYYHVDLDYRGRVYYIEPFFNFQGGDIARGTLQFAVPKPMTEKGEYWLAVHTANSYNMSYGIDELPEWLTTDYREYMLENNIDSISVDKMTLDDRVEWTNQHKDIILYLAAANALVPKAEKPVSYLACCHEWLNYNKAQDEERIYHSYLPIPVDGSNNGWQHLAAMSKDTQAGELVGLVPLEIQKDFYLKVAQGLKDYTTDPHRKAILESMPMKHIRKGISKRGSMTKAYSAGAKTMAKNMWSDIRKEDFDVMYGISEEDCAGFAKDMVKVIKDVCAGPLQTMKYLQQLVMFELGSYSKMKGTELADMSEYKKLKEEFKELGEEFPKTDEQIQRWNDLAVELATYKEVLVSGNGNDVITWTSPSGFPVEYKAFFMNDLKVKGTIAGKRITHVGKTPGTRANPKKFASGISPNFVHSHDAAHMSCLIADWPHFFGAVHDSFSTHACNVDELVQITKEVFIEMYEDDNFMENIKYQLLSGNYDLVSTIEVDIGDLDIVDVLDSDYFFA